MKRMSLPVVAAVLLMGLAALSGLVAVPASPALAVNEHATDHASVVAFWTPERVASAVPRDYVLQAGSFKPAAKPGRTDSSTVMGASWPGGGLVKETTGKVLFVMGSGYYVCSASVVDDGVAGRSVILTAGHCVVDESTGEFASNWMFIPDYDEQPAQLSADGSFCSRTVYGCWVADVLIASDEFATAGGFTSTATRHDYAFAVVDGGGLDASTTLDEAVGAQPMSFARAPEGSDSYLFGYPSAGKYRGNDLVYSRGLLGFDAGNDNATYRVGSSMTGGSSGGPWFSGFAPASGTGTVMSVTSYGYSGTKALFGPVLNTETEAMLALARTTSLQGGNQLG